MTIVRVVQRELVGGGRLHVWAYEDGPDSVSVRWVAEYGSSRRGGHAGPVQAGLVSETIAGVLASHVLDTSPRKVASFRGPRAAGAERSGNGN